MLTGSCFCLSPLFRRKPNGFQGLKRSNLRKSLSKKKGIAGGSHVCNSSDRASNSDIEMAVREKVFTFRDILDLPPCHGSASAYELVVGLMEDLQNLYPEIVLPQQMSKMKEASFEQGLAYLCNALKSIGDSWMLSHDWMNKFKKDLSSYEINSSSGKHAENVLAMLDCMINMAKEKFGMMDEGDKKKDYSRADSFGKMSVDSYSDSSYCSSSPVTPTSVLPFTDKPTKAKQSPNLSNKSPLLWSLRVQAVGKLNPIDVRNLSLHLSAVGGCDTSISPKNNMLVEKESAEIEVKRNPDTTEGVIRQEPIDNNAEKDIPELPKENLDQEECEIKDGNSIPTTLEAPAAVRTEVSLPTLVLSSIVPPPPPPPPKPTPVTPEQLRSPGIAVATTMPEKLIPSLQLPNLHPNVKASPPLAPSPPIMHENVAVPPPPPPPPLQPILHSNVKGQSPRPPMPAGKSMPTPPPPPLMHSKGPVPPPPRTLGNGSAPAGKSMPTPPPPPLMHSKGPVPPPPMTLGNGSAPPPPPLGGNLRAKKNSKLKRSTQIGNLYRTLKGKIEGSSPNGKSRNGRKNGIGSNPSGKQGMADALAEMTKRSTYFLQIEEDVEKYAKLIMEIRTAISSFQTKDMEELMKFHKNVESILEKLTDESQVLSRFEGFPTKKLEAMRTAAALYKKLSSILTELQNWKIAPHLGQLLDNVERYFNKIKGEMEAMERTKDEESKKFQSHNIHFDFNILLKIKETMVDVSSSCMELALKERREVKAAAEEEKSGTKNEGRKEGCIKMLWRAFQFAFRVYTFAGGHDDRADELTKALAQEIESHPHQEQ